MHSHWNFRHSCRVRFYTAPPRDLPTKDKMEGSRLTAVASEDDIILSRLNISISLSEPCPLQYLQSPTCTASGTAPQKYPTANSPEMMQSWKLKLCTEQLCHIASIDTAKLSNKMTNLQWSRWSLFYYWWIEHPGSVRPAVEWWGAWQIVSAAESILLEILCWSEDPRWILFLFSEQKDSSQLLL